MPKSVAGVGKRVRVVSEPLIAAPSGNLQRTTGAPVWHGEGRPHPSEDLPGKTLYLSVVRSENSHADLWPGARLLKLELK